MKYLYIFALTLLALLGPYPAHADSRFKNIKETDIQLTYSVYAASLLEAMHITVGLTFEKDSYVVDTNIRTNGFLSRVLPWSGQFFTQGMITKTALIPEQHVFSKNWSQDTAKTTMNFDRKGRLANMVVEDTEDDPYYQLFDDEITFGAVDMLTALMESFVNIDNTSICRSSHTVFDGKRRFELVFRDLGKTTLTNKRYSMYSGPALTCEIEVVPIAGKWYNNTRGWMALQEQSKENGRLPKLWLAKVDNKSPMVPVRLQVRTDYGSLIMSLIEFSIDGKDLTDIPTAAGE